MIVSYRRGSQADAAAIFVLRSRRKPVSSRDRHGVADTTHIFSSNTMVHAVNVGSECIGAKGTGERYARYLGPI